ncbi:MAG: DUF1449 family protein [Abitibacteriaceae bacterium]|nr:DUF1449 family protein [Abditibacteriaceae bacterium]MBV9866054.1 DUF1449 family protein [Abditibacteriaceae bacterium]
MNTVAELGQWWNLIYVIPFCLGVVLVLLSVLGAGRHGMGGHHAGHGMHLGHGHVGQSVGHSLGHGGHVGHSATHGGGHGTAHGHAATHGQAAHSHAAHGQHGSHAQGHSHHGNSQHGHSSHGQDGRSEGIGDMTQGMVRATVHPTPWSLAAALHIQNIPPLMLAQNFMLFWGIFGWAANQFFGKSAHDPARFIVPSLLATVAGSLVITILLSAVMSRFTPSDETFAVTKRDLEGRLGEAVSTITDRMGSVYARDAVGTLHHLPCRIAPDGAPIAKGEQVLVIEYHPEGDYYRVKSWKPDTE